MIHRCTYAALAAVGLSLVGCGSKSGYVATSKPVSAPAPATVQPGEEASLIPLAVGNQWTYSQETNSQTPQNGQSSGTSEVTIKVVKVGPTPGGKEAELELSVNGTVTNRQVWQITKDGVFQARTGLKLDPMTPPQPLAHFPIKDDEQTKWSGVGPFGGEAKVDQSSTLTTKGTRMVDTDMGQMSAIMFQSVTTVKKGGKDIGATEFEMWLKPGTGMARISETLVLPKGREVVLLRLKSFTPKNP